MQHQSLLVRLQDVDLPGELSVPDNSRAIVLFSHGSGSSRNSPRNKQVAESLWEKGISTFLFDLLTEKESKQIALRFDITLLTHRLEWTTNWLIDRMGFDQWRIGYFGASTGAAAALKVASRNSEIAAVVSRGGRPDLVLRDLSFVSSPTLLIVGEKDREVMAMNQRAYQELTCKKKLVVIPGATHLFEEPGTMGKVAEIAGNWFQQFLLKKTSPLSESPVSL